MCASVEFCGELIESTIALSKALGVPVMLDHAMLDPSEDQCLCNCDIRRMAEEAGRACFGYEELCKRPNGRNIHIPGDWVIE